MAPHHQGVTDMGNKAAAIAVVLALAGCAGTELQFAGKVCGQDVSLALIDRKDRSGFDAQITCGPEGSIMVSTSDSSTSAVIAAQAELAARLGDTITKLAGAAAPTPEPERAL